LATYRATWRSVREAFTFRKGFGISWRQEPGCGCSAKVTSVGSRSASAGGLATVGTFRFPDEGNFGRTSGSRAGDFSGRGRGILSWTFSEPVTT